MMTPITLYINFVHNQQSRDLLVFHRHGEDYQGTNYNWENVEKLLALSDRMWSNEVTVEEVRELGDQLKEILLRPVTIYLQQLRPDQYLRLILNFNQAPPEIWALPWEMSRDENGTFLFASGRHTLLRYRSYAEWNENNIPAEPLKPPCRVLVATAQPSDYANPEDRNVPPGLIPVASQTEEKRIEEVLKADNVRKIRLCEEDLINNLKDFRPHVLHLITHGFIINGEYKLLGVNSEGFSRSLAPGLLKNFCERSGHWPRLLVLHACHSADLSSYCNISGVEMALCEHMPLGVGFLREPNDSESADFSEHFYEELAAGKPFDLALSSARQFLYNKYGVTSPCWKGPVAVFGSLRAERAFTIVSDSSNLQIQEVAPKLPQPPETEPTSVSIQPMVPVPPSKRTVSYRRFLAPVMLIMGFLLLAGGPSWFILNTLIPSDMVLLPGTENYIVGCFDHDLFVEKANDAGKLEEKHLQSWFEKKAEGNKEVLKEVTAAFWLALNIVAQKLQELHPESVRIKPFLLDRYEVTNAEYAAFLQANPMYPPPPHWSTRYCPVGRERLPVAGITYREAWAYAKWAKKRLPTYAEWQYAACGGLQILFPWGNDPQLGKANLMISWAEPEESQAVPVDQYEPNRVGLWGMGGNVREFAVGPRNTPVVCGGSFEDELVGAVTFRREEVKETDRSLEVGFRCARDWKPREHGLIGLFLALGGGILLIWGLLGLRYNDRT